MSNLEHCLEKAIIDTEYSTEFDKLRKSRVEVSYYKYGAARDNFGSGRVDAIGSLELCLDKFKKTGNTEYLLDVANYAMFRYMFPLHLKRLVVKYTLNAVIVDAVLRQGMKI